MRRKYWLVNDLAAAPKIKQKANIDLPTCYFSHQTSRRNSDTREYVIENSCLINEMKVNGIFKFRMDLVRHVASI